jgi:hypothetical protein
MNQLWGCFCGVRSDGPGMLPLTSLGDSVSSRGNLLALPHCTAHCIKILRDEQQHLVPCSSPFGECGEVRIWNA